MLLILSPAKRINKEPINSVTKTEVFFPKEMNRLLKVLKTKSVEDLKDLMKISNSIAELNVERYKKMKIPFPKDESSAAIFTFQGDAYLGLAADNMSQDDLLFSQYHLRILSGFYGILRPYDAIMPYRLEMGIKLVVKDYKNLYDFWSNKITKQINIELKEIESEILINLASKEYFKSVDVNKLNARVITINFKEFRNNEYKFVSAYGKKARGLMCRYIIKNRLTDPEELKTFNYEGYSFNTNKSTENEWLFSRPS